MYQNVLNIYFTLHAHECKSQVSEFKLSQASDLKLLCKTPQFTSNGVNEDDTENVKF